MESARLVHTAPSKFSKWRIGTLGAGSGTIQPLTNLTFLTVIFLAWDRDSNTGFNPNAWFFDWSVAPMSTRVRVLNCGTGLTLACLHPLILSRSQRSLLLRIYNTLGQQPFSNLSLWHLFSHYQNAYDCNNARTSLGSWKISRICSIG